LGYDFEDYTVAVLLADGRVKWVDGDMAGVSITKTKTVEQKIDKLKLKIKVYEETETMKWD